MLKSEENDPNQAVIKLVNQLYIGVNAMPAIKEAAIEVLKNL